MELNTRTRIARCILSIRASVNGAVEGMAAAGIEEEDAVDIVLERLVKAVKAVELDAPLEITEV